MKVYKLFTDYEKEEAWLNEMSQKGYAFIDYSFAKYTFTSSQPGEYIYRIELLEDLPSNPSSQDYIDFCRDLDIEHVGTYFRWVYFRKKSSQGPFEIFSDNSSKRQHLKKVIALQGIAGIICFAAGISNLIIGTYSGINLIAGLFSIAVSIKLGQISYKNYKKINALKIL